MCIPIEETAPIWLSAGKLKFLPSLPTQENAQDTTRKGKPSDDQSWSSEERKITLITNSPKVSNPLCNAYVLWLFLMEAKLLIYLLALMVTVSSLQKAHQPQRVRWEHISASTGEVLNTTEKIVPGVWWLEFIFDLCDLDRGSWNMRDWSPLHEGWSKCGRKRGAPCLILLTHGVWDAPIF